MAKTSKRLDGRIALITGASRGIGAAVARRYAAEGAHVIATARTQAGLEELDDAIKSETGANATLLPMDMSDFDNIDKMGAAIYERFGRLDIVVGNAGTLGDLTPIHQLDPKVWDQVMAINLTANWRLLRAVDPLIRASDAGRAIFLSSGITKGPRAYWSAYAISKTALEYMVRMYQAENEKTHIRANLIDPGATRTTMRATAYPGEDPMTLKTPDDITETFVELAEPSCALMGEVIRLG
ncbi:MAG: SDR family NAD(P)-dependent oxidoreductase [Rhodospirillales bacterium]|nr:SDR family NAD(P)-dependent oxidoreductase [Rhodospirillales bacterium]MCW8970315.1 SDR family NAD(P)-dependent oxidoreductase [Rhodospirillales bacterium]MCW9002613.1 SDR family NAD(P)-dependent oxidoreductase [Rhodospirillales bacterium]